MNHYAILLCLLLTACGPGGGTGSSDNTLLHTDWDSCNNNYYRQLTGTYTGTATLDNGVRQCAWFITVRIYEHISGAMCMLDAAIDAPVEQYTVPDEERTAYQCIGLHEHRDVSEENRDTFKPAEHYEALPFPVQISMKGPIGEESGPYFGAESVLAKYVRLFEGGHRVTRSVMINSDNTLSLRGPGFSGDLLKVKP